MPAILPLHFITQIPFYILDTQQPLHQCPMPAWRKRCTVWLCQERPPMGSIGMLMCLTSVCLCKHLRPGHQACKPDFSGHLGTEEEKRLLFNFKDQSLVLSTCKQTFLSIWKPFGFKKSLVYTIMAFSSPFCSQPNAEMSTEVLCRSLEAAHSLL